MIAGDGACIPDGGVHAPLLCPNVVPEKLLLLDRVLAFQLERQGEAAVAVAGVLRRNVTCAPSAI